MESMGEEETDAWDLSIKAPSQITSLSNHDAKLLLIAVRRHENNAKEEEEASSSYWDSSSLWDSVQVIPGSKSEKLPPSLAALSAVYAGKVMLKITLAGGVILAAAQCVSMGLPWWQRPAARWLMRSYAINYSWFSVGTSGLLGASDAAACSEQPGGATTTTMVASTVGGGVGAYLGTLAFVTLI